MPKPQTDKAPTIRDIKDGVSTTESEEILKHLKETVEVEMSTLRGEIEAEITDLRKIIEAKTEELKELQKKIDRKSILGLEDQLFFGVVFSLLLLAIQFPSFEDLTLWFERLRLDEGMATYTAQILKTSIIVLLLAASLFRYYGSVKGKAKLGRLTFELKLVSMEILILCICFFLAEIILTAYGSWALQQNVLLVFTAPVIAAFVFVGVGVLEERWIKWYSEIGQIERQYAASIYLPFVWISVAFLLMLLIVVVSAVISTFVFPFPQNPYIFLVLAGAISALLLRSARRRKPLR